MAKPKTKKEVQTLLRPGDEGYDAEKDPHVVGYVPGSSAWMGNKGEQQKTPYDFMADKKTGMRPGETRKPWGASSSDLTNGIESYTTLPSIYIWKEGAYLADAYWTSGFKEDELPAVLRTKIDNLDWSQTGKTPAEIWNYYIVSGEGTPGNNYYRIYLLPHEIAKDPHPHHPLMWPKALKEKKPYKYSSYSGQSAQQQTPTTTTKKTQSLPAGVRIRCTGCGHWFKMSDLTGHSQVCPKDGEADWAMMCDDACGCTTLDQVSKPKPGFPRVAEPAEKKTKAKTAATDSQPAVAP